MLRHLSFKKNKSRALEYGKTNAFFVSILNQDFEISEKLV